MKGKAKRFFITLSVLALALCFCLACAACGEKTEPTPPPDNGGDPTGDVTVAELLIVEAPDKIDYYAGESFDPTDMIVKAKWSDGLKTTIKIEDCTITPAGALSSSDTKVTITYEGKSVTQAIKVKDIGIDSITVGTGNAALKGAVGTPMDFSRIKVTAAYADGASREVTGGYTVTVKKASAAAEMPVEDLSAVSFEERGTYVFTVTYGQVSDSFTVEILNGFIVEAENIIDTDKITDDDKNFVEKVSGVFGAKSGDNEPASGGKYMGSVFKDAVMRFHISVEEDCFANVIMRASSCLMEKDGGSWDPLIMGDQQFNKMFDAKYGVAEDAANGNLKPLYIDDDVILKGGTTDNPLGDRLLFVNWMDVNFGTIPLKAGDNVIELKVITDYVNCRGEKIACNIDRLEIEYTDDYTPPATVTGLTVKTPPTKIAYVTGETFDPEGMVVEAIMSDETTESVDIAKCKITPARALTPSDSEVTITYRDASVTQAITVAGNTVYFEAENIVSTPTAEDKYYTETVRSGYQGSPGVKVTEAPGVADTSNGKYLNGLFGSSDGQSGAVVRFHIWSDTACKAEIKVYASSCNVTVKGSDGASNWNPSEIGDVQFNRIFAVKFGTADALTPVAVGDGVIVEGGKTADGKVSMALWENWREISLGEFDFTAGDNILELENINSTLRNLAGETYGMNIDRLSVEFK